NDGRLDLAVAGNSGLSVLLGNGDGSFQPAQNYPAGFRPPFVTMADVNNDGWLDLLVPVGTVRVLLGVGDGTFQATRLSYVAGGNSLFGAVGDFNGDGFSDLAVANFISSDVSVLLNDGIWTGPGGAPGDRPDNGSGLGPAALDLLADEARGSRRLVRPADASPPPGQPPRAPARDPAVHPMEPATAAAWTARPSRRVVDRLFADELDARTERAPALS